MTQPFRLPSGGRIDRARTLAFAFDGAPFAGHPGDTLASALLANGVHLVARSPRFHRPRGILSAGIEEPNALVEIDGEPSVRATQVELHDGLEASSQGGWPSLARDAAALADRLAPTALDYRTRWPRPAWMHLERAIRRRATGGRAPAGRDPHRYDRRHAHADVLVVGGGPAGLAAALAAGRAGARVILADEQMELGGRLLAERDEIDGRPADAWLRDVARELAGLPEVRMLPRTTVFGAYDHGFVAALERVTDHLGRAADPRLPRQRLWKIRARRIVLATGAIERPLVFADNDRPGIMLAGAVRTYVNRFAVAPGRRAVVLASGDDAARTVRDLKTAGLTVVAVVARRGGEPPPGAANADGVEVLVGHVVVGARGRRCVTAVEVAPAAGGGPAEDRHHAGPARVIECDLVAMSGGWAPALHLFAQARGALRFDPSLEAFAPGAAPEHVRAAGACAGLAELGACLADGDAAGLEAALACGAGGGARSSRGAPARSGGGPAGASTGSAAPSAAPAPRDLPPAGADRRAFVDFQTDVTAADIRAAATAGFGQVEHLKRYTGAGTGADQGKTSALEALAVLAEAREAAIPAIGHTTLRPPYTPIALGAIAGRDIGPLFDPVRRTPMHAWHEAHGAVFDDVGQWKRAWYYPRAGEVMRQAVSREVRAARTGVALLDASTLGKIEVRGPDAGAFLDRIYTNRMSTLAPGRCRYGLVLTEDGMVMDDGVVTRLGSQHFLLSTTTGNAARVLAWLEEWLQTEWPSLRVHCTSVTEQWAVATVVGPASRDLLAPLTGADLDARRFPFMSACDASVAGVPARLFRVSFTGELSYEVAVPADRGLAVWEALVEAGRSRGLTPFGTEAMHVLRCEKGYIVVGHETDGSVTPIDLGLGALCSRGEDFVGRRSLARADTARGDRKQLVGLLTDDPHEVLPEGGQIVADVRPRPPMEMVGHVTSSYWSPTCDRSIALALVRNGRALLGRALHVPLPDRVVSVRVVDPRFHDPEGVRLRG